MYYVLGFFYLCMAAFIMGMAAIATRDKWYDILLGGLLWPLIVTWAFLIVLFELARWKTK